MSKMNKIKIEPLTDDFNQSESDNYIENNIKKEKEVQFVLILPPRQVKVEEIEKEEVHENNKNKFQCQQCPKSFTNRHILYRHEESHKPKIKCQICNKKISNRNLKDHLKRHENIKKFNCDHCRVGFVIKGELICHMWKHRSEKRFNCKQCNRGFNGNQKFKVHLQSHTNNPRPFQCDLCPKSYPRKGQIMVHLAIHSKLVLKCDECDYSTKRKDALNVHKKRMHSNAKPFSCEICEKKFKAKAHVQVHQSVHTTTKNFECKICGKMFGTQSNLKQHEKGVHGKNFQIFLLQT
jgi:KRAB domain-containing zinc finger protein